MKSLLSGDRHADGYTFGSSHFLTFVGRVTRGLGLVPYFANRAIRKSIDRTIIGWFWIPIRCLVPVLVTAIFFGSLLNVDSGEVPYFLFLLVGTTAWMLFVNSLMWVIRCLELNRNYVRKMYFPRIVLPIGYTAPALIDFGCHLVVVTASIVFFGASGDGWWFPQSFSAVLLVLAAALMAITFGASIGAIFSLMASNARDFRFSAQFVTAMWFFFTPVAYPLSSIPVEWQFLGIVNPMAPIVEVFRMSITSSGAYPATGLSVSVASTLILFVAAVYIYVINDQRMSDLV